MLKKIIFIIFVSVFFFTGCEEEESKKYEYVESKDGKSVYLDNQSGRVIYINKSNRVDDFVELKINEADIERINKDKIKNDSSQKRRDWNTQEMSGTKYSVSLQARYYKDRLLYKTDIGPYDDSIIFKTTGIQIHLLDESGFSLEKIIPAQWLRVVDANGKAMRLSYSGEIPMTLDNYLEIADWSFQW